MFTIEEEEAYCVLYIYLKDKSKTLACFSSVHTRVENIVVDT
jgi:hypothetical protein